MTAYRWAEDVAEYSPHHRTWTVEHAARVAGTLAAGGIAAAALALVGHRTQPRPIEPALTWTPEHTYPHSRTSNTSPASSEAECSPARSSPCKHLTTGSYCPPWEWVEFFHTGEPEAVCTVHGYNPPEPELLPNYFTP